MNTELCSTSCAIASGRGSRIGQVEDVSNDEPLDFSDVNLNPPEAPGTSGDGSTGAVPGISEASTGMTVRGRGLASSGVTGDEGVGGKSGVLASAALVGPEFLNLHCGGVVGKSSKDLLKAGVRHQEAQ